jgi:hypothetical protein
MNISTPNYCACQEKSYIEIEALAKCFRNWIRIMEQPESAGMACFRRKIIIF